jgi:hypothetical protein
MEVHDGDAINEREDGEARLKWRAGSREEVRRFAAEGAFAVSGEAGFYEDAGAIGR